MEIVNRIIHALTQLHPLHAMTVHFPIGLSGAAALFIVLAAVLRSKALEQAAVYNLVLVVPATILAGITGMRDNFINYDGAAPNGGVKVLLSLVLLVLAAATVVIRWRNQELLWKPASRLLYIAVFVINFVLAAVLGFLGGVILYGF